MRKTHFTGFKKRICQDLAGNSDKILTMCRFLKNDDFHAVPPLSGSVICQIRTDSKPAAFR